MNIYQAASQFCETIPKGSKTRTPRTLPESRLRDPWAICQWCCKVTVVRRLVLGQPQQVGCSQDVSLWERINSQTIMAEERDQGPSTKSKLVQMRMSQTRSLVQSQPCSFWDMPFLTFLWSTYANGLVLFGYYSIFFLNF